MTEEVVSYVYGAGGILFLGRGHGKTCAGGERRKAAPIRASKTNTGLVAFYIFKKFNFYIASDGDL